MVGIDNLADQSIILSETIQSLTKEQKKEFNKKLKHRRKKLKKRMNTKKKNKKKKSKKIKKKRKIATKKRIRSGAVVSETDTGQGEESKFKKCEKELKDCEKELSNQRETEDIVDDIVWAI